MARRIITLLATGLGGVYYGATNSENVKTTLSRIQGEKVKANPKGEPVAEILSAAGRIARKAKLANLCTISTEGWTLIPRSRVVNPVPSTNDLPSMRFDTNRLSRKYKELKDNPNVCLTYCDNPGAGYVSIYGTASELSPEETRAQWKEDYREYLAEGFEEGGRYCAFSIEPSRMELCSYSEGIAPEREDWMPVVLDYNKEGKWVISKEQAANWHT